MQWRNVVWAAFILLLCACGRVARGQARPTPRLLKMPEIFYMGADPSEIPEIEDLGVHYFNGSTQGDPFAIMRANGLNIVRFRTWVNPTKDGLGNVTPAGYCDKAHTLALAKRASQAGLRVAIDFHYSDWWADPAHQTKPAAWASMTHAQLVQQVYSYTKDVVSALVAQGTPPEIVQPGNEISAGMLWTDGQLTTGTSAEWQRLADLLNAGIRGTIEGAGRYKIRTMIHIDRGGDNAGARWFLDHLATYNVAYDLIGLSYYPWWQGSMSALQANLTDLASRYHKKILVAETAYPYTLDFTNHNWSHIVGDSSQLVAGYPATSAGQAAFLTSLLQVIRSTPNNMGAGLLYWAPAWLSVGSYHNGWDNLALFDDAGRALPGLAAMGGQATPIARPVNRPTHGATKER